MPKYTYKCEECKGFTVVYHGYNEPISKCELCDSLESLRRLPSAFILGKSKDDDHAGQKPGTLVKEFIDSAKEDLIKQKEELTREWNDK